MDARPELPIQQSELEGVGYDCKFGLKMQQEKAASKTNSNVSKAASLEDPSELAISFANVVTQVSDYTDNWVARNGDKSIFSVLRLVLPEVSQVYMVEYVCKTDALQKQFWEIYRI
jgi:hypothetical protein